MQQHPGYEVIYGVSLLDDLHNYFPELLYNQGRFASVNSVFHYIRSQMSNRFNLFAFGQRRFRETQEPAEEEVVFTFPNMAARAAPPATATAEEDRVVTTNLAAATLLLGLLNGTTAAAAPTTPMGLGTGLGNLMFGPRTQGGGEAWTNFLNPVVRRPTAADISRNTELVTGVTDISCAVCQDQIRADNTARRLIPCRHVYHQTCIDTWFERSVFCPTCRHDIREP